MAGKKTAPRNGSAPTKVRGRTADGDGPPARTCRKPGNPGFAGYEYQIDVSVWVALDLMFAKGATDVIEIEPRSEEDIQASVEDPAAASLGLDACGAQFRLYLQAKTRSGSPWSAAAIADVLRGKNTDVGDRGRRRARPLQLLQADPQSRYVFVTNEASAAGLRPHEGEHLLDFPEVDELPPHARTGIDAAEQASLAPRIVLLTGVTREVIDDRIEKLLAQHGHVPAPKRGECLRDLRDAQRQRIAGAHGGRLTRSDVMGMLISHGGSLAPTRDLDHYVRPKSYEAIKTQLDTRHAAVISGPSGTGKTLTADILELELRRGQPPFDVIGEEHGPGYIRSNLRRTDPVLFHLRDPWGGNRLTPGADQWSGELLKLLDNAGPGRKFLVTSRSDVMQSAGADLANKLSPYIVSIEVEDYGPELLAEIYDRNSADLTGHAKKLAVLHRRSALSKLTRPYEVQRFLVALSREDGEEPREVELILADSQIEAISSVIADQIGADEAEAAAVIWALLSERRAITRDAFVKLGRRLRAAEPNLKPDIDGLIDFLIAGRNLRQDRSVLSFHHPRVEDGLRMVFMRRARDSERVLSTAVDVLLAWDQAGKDWGLETGLDVLRAVAKVEDLELDISQASVHRLDEHLVAVTLSADTRADFEGALRNLAKFGSENLPPARLARILIEGGPEPENYVLKGCWYAPSLCEKEISSLRDDIRTRPIIERFIRDVLPYLFRFYYLELIPLLEGLAPSLSHAYWDTLDSIVSEIALHENIEAMVSGALFGDSPDYERAIERFAGLEAEADTWRMESAKEIYEAEEHVVDADEADRIIDDEPWIRYFDARAGMRMVVKLRCQREGVTWIAGHSHQDSLLRALAEQINHNLRTQPTAELPIEELEFLLANGDDDVRELVWSVAVRPWDDSLSALLVEELSRSDIDNADLRCGLIWAAVIHGESDPVPALVFASARATFARRLELVYDVIATKFDGDPEKEKGVVPRRAWATRLSDSFAFNERELAKALLEVLEGNEFRTIAGELSEPTRQLLVETLANVSNELAGPLACLAAGAGLSIGDTTTRLLSTDNAKNGKDAIQAYIIANGTGLRTELQLALKHKRYPVRRKAFRFLAINAAAEERIDLLAVAVDRSADVRLAFAEAMKELRWPEAIDALVKLLGDERNFASLARSGPTWSKCSVARAAAHALGAYQVLPGHAIDALSETAQADNPDPFVACAALSALARQDDSRIVPMLLSALATSSGLDRSPTHRPLAQAAAWAIFDRTINNLTDMLTPEVAEIAKEAPAPIAIPLLLAFANHPGDERETLLTHFNASRLSDQVEIMRTAAILANRTEGLSLDDREQALLRLSCGEPTTSLSPEELSVVKQWSLGLDVNSEFGHCLGWIAHNAYQLPLNGEVGDIRAYDLPERNCFVTLRSHSPYGEEDGDQVDDGF